MNINNKAFYDKWIQKYDQLYYRFPKWNHWKSSKGKIYGSIEKKKEDKYEQEIQAIIDKQYQLNKDTNNQQTLYNLIYEKGISKDLKNNSIIRSISFEKGGKVILDIQNPQGFDYFYRKQKNEEYQYPHLIQQNPPLALQTNEKLMEMLCKEGQISTQTTFSPLYPSERNFYLAVSVIFALKFLYLFLS